MMRRKDQEITDPALIAAILKRATVLRLALAKENVPYLVPVSFGYDGQDLYFHTAPQGRKLDFIAANNLVCFEVEGEVQLQTKGTGPCSWTFAYQSVIGYGRVRELLDPADKQEALRHIANHYAQGDWELDTAQVAATRVWQITVQEMSGKQSPRPTRTR